MKDLFRSILSMLGRQSGTHLSPAPTSDSGRRLTLLLHLGNEDIQVGTLTHESGKFVFAYTADFCRRDLPVIPGFSRRTTERYESTILWPFFQLRLPPTSRDDVARVIAENQIDTDDVFEMLRILGRRTLTSPYKLEAVTP